MKHIYKRIKSINLSVSIGDDIKLYYNKKGINELLNAFNCDIGLLRKDRIKFDPNSKLLILQINLKNFNEFQKIKNINDIQWKQIQNIILNDAKKYFL